MCSRSRSSTRGRPPGRRKRGRVSNLVLYCQFWFELWQHYTARRRFSSPVVICGPKAAQQRRPSNVASSFHQFERRKDFPVRACVLAFIFGTCSLDRSICIFLLPLPHLCVSSIFLKNISTPKIKQGILEAAAYRKDYPESTTWFEFPTVQFGNLEMTWQHFRRLTH